MKIVSIDSYDSYNFKALLYEIYLHKILQPLKEHVLFLHNIYVNDYGENRKKHVILLFENCEFTLSDVIEHRSSVLHKSLPEAELLFYMKELCKSFAFLETSSVCHRDIRPENIWFSLNEKKFKIAFLYNARFYQGTTSRVLDHNNLLNTFRGKPYLSSPEVGKNLEVAGSTMGIYNAIMNDVYGLGLVFLCLKTSKKQK
jgi:serine/threonine protein kinase